VIPTTKREYGDGELRIGWASWDNGEFKHRSIKYAYKDRSGKVSRGCPELPFDVLVDIVSYAYEEGELTEEFVQKLRDTLS